MYSLIVLGIIPGTNIQITFVWWLLALSGLLTVRIVRRLQRKQSFTKLQLYIALYAIRHRQLPA